jgi:hypothetical protein
MSSSIGSSASELSRESSAITVLWGDVLRSLAAALELLGKFSFAEGKGTCFILLVLGLTVAGCFRFDIVMTKWELGVCVGVLCVGCGMWKEIRV